MSEPSVRVASPFLQSDTENFPSLKRIDLPIGAVAEYQQQMQSSRIDLPYNIQRESKRIYANKPAHSCAPTFRFAFNAFCSARRAMSPSTMDEAEAMMSSETIELIDFANGTQSKHGSVPARGVCISLLVPLESIHNSTAIPFTDGFAALSNSGAERGLPIATKVRFSIYGGGNTLPASKALSREAFDKTTIEGASILMRWTESNEYNACTVRTECTSLETACPAVAECSRHIQTAVLKMSVKFGVQLPPEFYKDPPVSFAGFYEKQIVDCSTEWCKILHNEEPFVASPQMTYNHSSILIRVPGCYVRLSPIALGLEGVTSPEVIHAILLCGEGMDSKAAQYARTYREGLRPPDGEDLLMDLHTIALHTERVYLQAMVSMYAHGGKPGACIKADGNWVYKTTAAVVPIDSLRSKFFVMSCDMESMLPENTSLTRFMDAHLQKSLDLFTRLFADNDSQRMLSTNTFSKTQEASVVQDSTTLDDSFVLSALGIDLRSSRMTIGESISYLMQTNGPTSLIELLTELAASQVGLRSTLNDGYSYCTDLLKQELNGKESHTAEVARLKRIADAALVIGASKRACLVTQKTQKTHTTKASKVRALMKTFSIKAGPSVSRIDDFVTVPRSYNTYHSLATTIYECYAQKSIIDQNMPHLSQLEKVIETYEEMVCAICKALRVCMISPGKPKNAFVIVHGGDGSSVTIFSVLMTGEPKQCGAGDVFECDKPCIVVMKLKSDVACIVTPMVAE